MIRLRVEAPPDPTTLAPNDPVEVVVVGTGDPGRDAGIDVCWCAKTFSMEEDGPFPFIVEFARGSLFDAVSIRVEWFHDGRLVGRQYAHQRWPAGGVVEVPLGMSTQCGTDFCETATGCGDGGCACSGFTCVRHSDLAPPLVDGTWMAFPPCSGENCELLAADARADADVEDDGGDEVDAGDTADDAPDAGG